MRVCSPLNQSCIWSHADAAAEAAVMEPLDAVDDHAEIHAHPQVAGRRHRHPAAQLEAEALLDQLTQLADRVGRDEADPLHAGVAAEVIGEAGLGDRVTVIQGEAAEVLPRLRDSGPFCVVFLDADKGRYDQYGRWATENLRTGGLLIGDNAYLFGRLLDDIDEARAMRRFHEEMASNYRSVCIPTPDGLAVGVRVESRGLTNSNRPGI